MRLDWGERGGVGVFHFYFIVTVAVWPGLDRDCILWIIPQTGLNNNKNGGKYRC